MLYCEPACLQRKPRSADAAPAQTARSVVVVGGGPAGLKAALTAAQRGHQVTLVEQSGALGGLMIPASVGRSRKICVAICPICAVRWKNLRSM